MQGVISTRGVHFAPHVGGKSFFNLPTRVPEYGGQIPKFSAFGGIFLVNPRNMGGKWINLLRLWGANRFYLPPRVSKDGGQKNHEISFAPHDGGQKNPLDWFKT